MKNKVLLSVMLTMMAMVFAFGQGQTVEPTPQQKAMYAT